MLRARVERREILSRRWRDIEGMPLAEYNPRFAENPERADFNIQPFFFARALFAR
jgi:hypothetical protein